MGSPSASLCQLNTPSLDQDLHNYSCNTTIILHHYHVYRIYTCNTACHWISVAWLAHLLPSLRITGIVPLLSTVRFFTEDVTFRAIVVATAGYLECECDGSQTARVGPSDPVSNRQVVGCTENYINKIIINDISVKNLHQELK